MQKHAVLAAVHVQVLHSSFATLRTHLFGHLHLAIADISMFVNAMRTFPSVAAVFAAALPFVRFAGACTQQSSSRAISEHTTVTDIGKCGYL